MVYGGPFPRYPRTTPWEEDIEGQFIELERREKHSLRVLARKHEMARTALAKGVVYPTPTEIGELKERFEELKAESEAIQDVRMETLYPQGKDVSLMEAWARLDPVIAEKLDIQMDRETELRAESKALNSYLIYAGDERHRWESMTGYLQLITDYPDIIAEEPEEEPEIPEYTERHLKALQRQHLKDVPAFEPEKGILAPEQLTEAGIAKEPGLIPPTMYEEYGIEAPRVPEEVITPEGVITPEHEEIGKSLIERIIEFPLKGVEQIFTMIGAYLSTPFRLEDIGELEAWEKIPTVYMMQYLPGGKMYESYKKWKGSPEEPVTLIPAPSWKQWGEWLKPLFIGDKLLEVLGVDVSQWEETERFEWAQMGQGDLLEFAPLLFLGGGGSRTLGEEALKQALKQSAKGKSAQEAINIAFDQMAKKGKMPKFAVQAAPEEFPALPKPEVQPKAPPIKPEVSITEVPIKPKAPPKLPPETAKLVASRATLKEQLATPAKELPKGVRKIELRQQLRGINAKLLPAEKKLRQQIMTEVNTLGLSQSQYREIFRVSGGSRWLSQVSIERLPRVLEVVRVTRPVSIKGKKVLTPKTETDLLARKVELIDEEILTEESYKDILKVLKLSTDKYVNKELFISEIEARSILKEINNRAILAPLGELKFGKPTAVKFLTSDVYYGQVLGVHPLVEPLELAKVDFDLAYRAMSNAIVKQINSVNRAFKVSIPEEKLARVEGRPTKGVARLRDLLDKFEEAPAELTKQQKAVFNWFRNLNRTIINGENEVRRGLGMPEISYREAYVRHVPDSMADEILRGLHPLPPSLSYWSQRIVSKKIFNPMEFHRQLSDDLAKLYTKDLEQASRNMVYTGLKEIHLAQPLKTFTERMGALSDVMPASTRKWVVDFVNQRIKGQQTEWDAGLNRLVADSGFGGLVNDVLRPYRLSLGTQPVTKLAETVGHATILAVLGLPRPRLARLMIRNLFQRTQELALHNPLAIIKGFAFEKGKLAELMGRSRFLKGYTGVEEWPVDLMGKVGKIALAPYQLTAVINARQAMRVTYHDILSFFTKARYKDLGWASPKRTYKEAKDFLYPEEETLMLAEMELAGRATQYQYIGMGMPGIFRNKTLIPLTRLQSWWMNHFFMFHREAAHRLLYGETRLGHKLPWSKRVNYLTYLTLGGATLTSMGYGMSYLWKVIPHNLSPVGQFMTGLLTYVSADADWQREKGMREIHSAWKAMVPGPLAWDEFEKLWSGEMPLWQMFFYGQEEEGAPPRIPTWGIINRQPAIDMKTARQDIEEAAGQLGQTVPKELPDPYHYIDEATGEIRLYTPPEEEYVYTTVDMGAAIRRATLKLEDKDITAENEFSPLTLFYKEAESMWGHYYYNLPASQRIAFRESSEGAYIEAYLFFWGKLSVLRNPNSEQIVREWMRKYNIPPEAIPSLAKLG